MTAPEQPGAPELPGLDLRQRLDELREAHPLDTPEQRILRMLGPLVKCPRCGERFGTDEEICGLCIFETREATM